MGITILNEHLVNKIAAGEVVERPASIVKELVENAIDAGSSKIIVKAIQGGKESIEIEDNGAGMLAEDIPLALMRHATSKIKTEIDLYNIHTMGFRGEALPSIASVVKMEIYSGKADFPGVKAIVEEGNLLDIQACAYPQGTRIIVKDLFYNTPVRRNFLKSPVSENIHIYDTMVKLALSRPDISFLYASERKNYFKTPGNGNLKDAVLAIYGKDFTANFIPVNYDGDKTSLYGLISRPEFKRTNRKNQFFFINNRIIKGPMLYRAVDQAYKGFLVSREFPAVILFIKTECQEVDVNVHPQKTEVRFKDEGTIFSLIARVIREALSRLDISFMLDSKENENRSKINSGNYRVIGQPLLHNQELDSFSELNMNKKHWNYDYTGNNISSTMESQIVINENSGLRRRTEYRIIGQCFNSYIIVEKDDSIWLVDQHAAHERVNYSRLKERSSSAVMESQILAIPIGIDISTKQAEIVEKHHEVFAGLGFEVEQIGPDSIVIRAAPEFVQGKEMEVFYELLELIEDGKNTDIKEKGIIMMSCKQSIKAGEKLTVLEMEKLIDDLLQVENYKNCPHGRPTMLQISHNDLDKQVKR